MKTHLKKLPTLAILTGLLIFPAGLWAAPFSPGEKIDFVVSWMGIPAGTTTMSVIKESGDNPQKTLHLFLETRSNKFISTFYKVRNKSLDFCRLPLNEMLTSFQYFKGRD